MPFGGVLAVFTESLKYFEKHNLNKPFCVWGLPTTGIENFTSHEFLDTSAPENKIWRLLLGS